MKNRALIVVCCIVGMLSANLASAAIQPSFGVGCAWNATDIVVVTQKPDGLTVLETWHGQLKKDEQISVVGLPFAPIRVSTQFDELYKQAGKEPPTKAKTVSGERIVLFLKPLEIKPDAEITARPVIKTFQGASFWTGAYNAAISSAVWFDQEQSYAFMQMMNPGPSELHPYGISEENLKKTALAILAEKDSLEKAKSVVNPTERVAALLPLTRGSFGQTRRESLVELGKCGKPALSVLKEMIGNDAYGQSEVIKAIAEASGTDAGQENVAILEKEFAFWKAKAPELDVGWWNNAGGSYDSEAWSRLNKLRNRYGIMYSGLWILRNHPYPPSRELVTQILEFWTSQPQFKDMKQVCETCEQVLKVLDQHVHQ